MRLAVQHNGDEVLADVEAFLDDVAHQAFKIAATDLRDKARVRGVREVGRIYKIPAATIDKFVRLELNQVPVGFEASVIAFGKGFPLYAFQPRKVPGGISVSVKGRRFVIPGAFIATMPRSGHIGVFARGAYGGKGLRGPVTGNFGRFVFARGRRALKMGKRGRMVKTGSELPLNELFTMSPPDTFANIDVTSAMADRVEEAAGAAIKRAIRSLSFRGRG